MFTFPEVLDRSGIAARDVNVMLHSPRQREFQAHLPGLVRTRRAAMETYQAAHSGNAARALSQGRPWVASFVKTGPGRTPGTSAMLFTGLYANPGPRQRSRAEIAADPEVQWLARAFGGFRQLNDPGWTHWPWFDLRLSERLQDLQGRLEIEVRLTQSYVRLTENLPAPVSALHRDSAFDAAPPSWREMAVTAPLLQALPDRWADRLAHWRGIYLIVDTSDGQRYVGSAYGAENLLGRWRAHVAGDAGITVGLRDRKPDDFRFSILELFTDDTDPAEVIAREQTWMDRLDTVRFGLNRPPPSGQGHTHGA